MKLNNIINKHRVLVITPIWYPSVYHPHTRRIDQWLKIFNKKNIYPTIISLSNKPLWEKTHQRETILGMHPRVDKRGQLSIIKSRSTKLEIVKRITTVVHKYLLKNKIDFCLVSHPSLIKVIDGVIKRNKVILDFLDCPNSEEDILSFTFDSISSFNKMINGCNLVVFHNEEAMKLKLITNKDYCISAIPPVISGFKEAIGKKPQYITIHGRSSNESLNHLDRIMKLFPDNYMNQQSLNYKICGEMTRDLEPQIRAKVVFPCSDLTPHLRDCICPVLHPDCKFGISYRVLDVVEAGGYLIATKRAMEGYPFHDYPYVFETPEPFRDASKEIINCPKRAKTRLKELQIRFMHMAIECDEVTTNLLRKVI